MATEEIGALIQVIILANIEELMHHSDRGSQYTSLAYQAVLAQFHIQVSMSRKGDCYDNAMMESFFSSLKAENLCKNE